MALSDFRGKVVAINFIYTSCPLPNFCLRIANNFGVLQKRLKSQLWRDLVLLTITFDPAHDTPEVLAQYASRWNADPGSWHFLTGSHAVTGALADTIGFRYVYDPALRQYAHPSGVVVVTPDGRVSRYFFGVDYPPAALRASLVAAAGDQVGSPVRALLLRCLHYDPAVGRYTNAVVAASRILGLACIVLLGAGCLRLRARERPAPGGGTP